MLTNDQMNVIALDEARALIEKMREALKKCESFAVEWRGYIDDSIHIDASDEIEEVCKEPLTAATEWLRLNK